VILYELLTGVVPFDGETAVAIAFKQVSAEPLAPSALNPALPATLDAIVLRALAKDPAHRYADADEFIRGPPAGAACPAPVRRRARRARVPGRPAPRHGPLLMPAAGPFVEEPASRLVIIGGCGCGRPSRRSSWRPWCSRSCSPPAAAG